MRPKYKLARAARENLREISEYWADEAGPDAALEVVSGVIETIIILSGQPRAGVAAERFGAGVRKFPAGKYMIYYRLYGSRGIEILHVFHGAREQRKAWKPKSAPDTD
jgi:plasmid stabilization system protein ParE